MISPLFRSVIGALGAASSLRMPIVAEAAVTGAMSSGPVKVRGSASKFSPVSEARTWTLYAAVRWASPVRLWLKLTIAPEEPWELTCTQPLPRLIWMLSALTPSSSVTVPVMAPVSSKRVLSAVVRATTGWLPAWAKLTGSMAGEVPLLLPALSTATM